MFKKKEIRAFLNDSIAGKLCVDEQVKFLAEFTPEKVTAEQLKIFAKFMLSKITTKLKMPGAIDICGTGGSGLARINTSTIAAFILTELGVGVAKHGNKAASGRCGSFDLLEALGVQIDKSPEELEKMYRKKGLAFIFARNFHPVMKHFAEARKILGKPTILNLLGPLLNPAEPKMQIIGTSFKGQMRMIAQTAKLLGKKNVLIVRGEDGLDEVTLTGKTDVVELSDGKIKEYQIRPEDFGLKAVDFAEISGGNLETNKKIAEEILCGERKDSKADLVFVNCALVLKMMGKVEALRDGYELAKSVSGKRKLEACRGNVLEEIAASKIIKKATRNFFETLFKKSARGALPTGRQARALIAEVKFASPSKGKIYKGKIGAETAVKIAKLYEKYGASAVSVLTDEKYFNGSFEYLKKVKEVTKNVPILCKDFIVTEYQIFKAREYGADAILLIAKLLTVGQMQHFLKLARSLSMECLVEVHNEEELAKVLKTDAKIIGINNRNLSDFTIDLETTNRLVKQIPKDKIIVAESGISSREDLNKLDKRVDAILVGTGLMSAKNITKKIHELT
ncbi:anthranilate phosphoribosyltransferase [Candidatus Peregrinibacteria bacterium]|nr:anthranilate phosphoribosyltransferase [Candidatus Peregrinibacteria bacterium]